MPYDIAMGHEGCPAGKKWAVVNEQSGRVMGCHPTMEQARKQLAALYANEGAAMSDLIRLESTIGLTADDISEDGLQWVHVMPTAEKARNGPWLFTITDQDLETYAKFIEANAQKIPVDYDHAGSTQRGGSSRAAGWFQGPTQVLAKGTDRPGEQGQAEAPELWAEVKWTPRAVQEIRDGEFKFLSPEFSFSEKDEKTGLMTKAKELAAATLTNRPFFNLAPVTAGTNELLEKLIAKYGEETVTSLVEEDGILAAVWDTAYIDGLPDSAFLWIEAGGAKDAEGKTEPRSLRHFPVRNDAGAIDLPHLRNALSRIPQSNAPMDVKQRIQSEAQRLLQNANAALEKVDAEEEPKPITPVRKEDAVETDVLAALGVPEHADAPTILAAVQAKDQEIQGLKDQVDTLRAKAASADTLAKRVADLEAHDKAREIEGILAEEVRAARVLPGEVEHLAEHYKDDPKGLTVLLNSRPPNLFADRMKEIGYGGKRGIDPELAAIGRELRTSDPIDEDSARLHTAALTILAERGQDNNYTAEQYADALNAAASVGAF